VATRVDRKTARFFNTLFTRATDPSGGKIPLDKLFLETRRSVAETPEGETLLYSWRVEGDYLAFSARQAKTRVPSKRPTVDQAEKDEIVTPEENREIDQPVDEKIDVRPIDLSEWDQRFRDLGREMIGMMTSFPRWFRENPIGETAGYFWLQEDGWLKCYSKSSPAAVDVYKSLVSTRDVGTPKREAPSRGWVIVATHPDGPRRPILDPETDSPKIFSTKEYATSFKFQVSDSLEGSKYRLLEVAFWDSGRLYPTEPRE
jgi:hypothetical protein